ncbi:MAG TPA: DNA-3-methyladenine glycosylase I [Bacteroidota bacterium]|nr:DNA-3-methyladenine glycosylase I [Bacteroidota bacterium]
MPTPKKQSRCPWAGNDPELISYHDLEWGVPLHDERKLFELLILEGAQAGLSWSTILHKRENYRKAFDGFDVLRIARYDKRKIRALLTDAGIVRNRLKIEATIANAKAFISVQDVFGTFDAYIWQFVGERQIENHRGSIKQVPARTRISDRMSEELRKRGFRFVGSTIMYSFMQATGMVNDHLVSCFRHAEISKLTQQRPGSPSGRTASW